MSETEVKHQVQIFYDQVGWQSDSEGLYQNARYEDLRPVSNEYIHRCHLRINRYLKPQGTYLLDAGSGPVQYPEYLTYSEKYNYRVCVDISLVALKEARKRIGMHGIYVLADVSTLPFKSETMDGAVSLHTLHHLPLSDQKKAYQELQRVLIPASTAVVVNGWTHSSFMSNTQWLVTFAETIGKLFVHLSGRKQLTEQLTSPEKSNKKDTTPTGTYVQKLDASLLRHEIGRDIEIRVWRSVNVRFLRAIIHAPLAGRLCLRLLYCLEELFPHFFGEIGQYPLVILRKEGV